MEHPDTQAKVSTTVTSVAVFAPLAAVFFSLILGSLHFWFGPWVGILKFYLSALAVIVGFVAGVMGWIRFHKTGKRYLIFRCYLGILSPFVFLAICVANALLFLGAASLMTN
jgi:hypothetical protein